VLDMALAAGSDSSHFGGGLSIIEITATLYGKIMRIDKDNPQWIERDRFILSKGHGCLGYYTALAEVGYISEYGHQFFQNLIVLLLQQVFYFHHLNF